jgi:hypothetical protein
MVVTPFSRSPPAEKQFRPNQGTTLLIRVLATISPPVKRKTETSKGFESSVTTHKLTIALVLFRDHKMKSCRVMVKIVLTNARG